MAEARAVTRQASRDHLFGHVLAADAAHADLTPMGLLAGQLAHGDAALGDAPHIVAGLGAAWLLWLTEVRHLRGRDALQPHMDATHHDGVAVDHAHAAGELLAGGGGYCGKQEQERRDQDEYRAKYLGQIPSLKDFKRFKKMP